MAHCGPVVLPGLCPLSRVSPDGQARGSLRPGPLRRRTVEPLHAAALKRPATLGLAARYRHLGPEASAACPPAVVTPDRAQRAFSVLRWLTPMLLPANPTGTCETRARLALGLAGSQNRECRGDRGRHRGQSKIGDEVGHLLVSPHTGNRELANTPCAPIQSSLRLPTFAQPPWAGFMWRAGLGGAPRGRAEIGPGWALGPWHAV